MIKFHMGYIGGENNGELFLEEFSNESSSPGGVESLAPAEELSHKAHHQFTNTLRRSVLKTFSGAQSVVRG